MVLDILVEIGTYPFTAVANSLRYVFSLQFRAKTHNRWKAESLLYVVGEVIFSAVFTLVTVGILVYVAVEIISQGMS
jgi:hypothetical protein